MKQIIKDVLNDMSNSQVNLASEAARETVSSLISAALKTKGSYIEFTDSEIEEYQASKSWVCTICGENTFEVDYDYLGSGTNHLGCELKTESEDKVFGKPGKWREDIKTGHDQGGNYEIPEGLKRAKELSQEAIKEGIQKQAYLEMTSDGLPEGGDAQAVLESHKLAEEIVEAQEGTWIYESPDGGKTVFRRPFSDYDPKNKEEIDFKTKEPTGRKFTDYPFKKIENIQIDGC
jgi:hypothetical protein